MPLAVSWNSKSAIKYEKSNAQNRNLQKVSPKNKQIPIKTSNPQVLKKNRNSTKNKPKFAGKPQGWQHWCKRCLVYVILRSYMSTLCHHNNEQCRLQKVQKYSNTLCTLIGCSRHSDPRMGLTDDKSCVCGGIQSHSHILDHCTMLAPPRVITNTTNENLIEHLCNSSF